MLYQDKFIEFPFRNILLPGSISIHLKGNNPFSHNYCALLSSLGQNQNNSQLAQTENIVYKLFKEI